MWQALENVLTLPPILRVPDSAVVFAAMEGSAAARHLMTLRPHVYVQSWTGYRENGGMSVLYDAFYRRRGLTLLRLKTTTSHGGNDFVCAAPGRRKGREVDVNGPVDVRTAGTPARG